MLCFERVDRSQKTWKVGTRDRDVVSPLAEIWKQIGGSWEKQGE